MAAVGQKNFTVLNPEKRQEPSSENNYKYVVGYDPQTKRILIDPTKLTEVHWNQKVFPVKFSSVLSGWTKEYHWGTVEVPEKDQNFEIAQDLLHTYLSSKGKASSEPATTEK